jgi:steroid 5-alpha reductase family enzyme
VSIYYRLTLFLVNFKLMYKHNKIFDRVLGYAPFIICFIILYLSETFNVISSINGLTQLILFIIVVSIPAFITKRMSYVDIGWPWGLVCIGVLVLINGEGYWIRKYIISGMYLIAGLRMGIGAIILLKKGYLNKELSRYEYQRLRWKKSGYSNIDISLQYEIMIQCLANVTFLALPAIIQSYNPQDFISPLEIFGYLLWLVFLIIEHLADLQKQRFLRKAFLENKNKQVCNVGLWKYSRHPNYFAEWMVWNCLIISSLPSLFYFYSIEESKIIWIGLLISLIYISKIMYNTLVYYTGAIPSEYYSKQKRPDYSEIQKKTNMFFPGVFRKK